MIKGLKRIHAELDKNLPKTVWSGLEKHGLSWLKVTDSVRISLRDPVAFATRVIGREIERVDIVQVRPLTGVPGFLSTNQKALFHTDHDVFAGPPALQMFVCIRQSLDGGESIFTDSWKILKDIKRNDKELFPQLYTVPRAMLYKDGLWLSPTFFMHNGRFVCAHATIARQDDPIGLAFEKHVNRAPVTRLKLEPDDVFISNNHRMMHARTSFNDDRRFLVRFTIWPKGPMPMPPSDLVQPAKQFHRKSVAALSDEPLWIRRRFGTEHVPQKKVLYDFFEERPYPPDRFDEQKREIMLKAWQRYMKKVA